MKPSVESVLDAYSNSRKLALMSGSGRDANMPNRDRWSSRKTAAKSLHARTRFWVSAGLPNQKPGPEIEVIAAAIPLRSIDSSDLDASQDADPNSPCVPSLSPNVSI